MLRRASLRRPPAPGATIAMLLFAVIAVLALPRLGLHQQDLLVQAACYATFAISLDLVWGYAGILSLGHAAFFGIGAYAAAISATQLGDAGVDVLIGLGAGLVAAAVVAAAVGWAAFYGRRVIATYVTVLTLCVALILQQVAGLTSFDALADITGGANGISFQLTGWDTITWGWVAIAVVTVVGIASLRVVGSDFGRLLAGLNSNQDRLAYLGQRVPRLKLVIFVVSALVAALSGFLFGGYMQFVSPNLFGLQVSSYVVILVIAGGRGTILGPVAAAIALGFAGPAVSERFPELWQLILGVLFLLVVLLAPAGMLPLARRAAAGIAQRLGHGSAPGPRWRLERTPPPGARAGGHPAAEAFARIDGVEVAYGSLRVLRGVTLDLSDHAVVSIIGPNGAGKSTLVAALTDGRMRIAGQVTYGRTAALGRAPADVVGLGVARTFQGTHLMEDCTVADALFVAGLRGSTPSPVKRSSVLAVTPVVYGVMEATGLTEVLDVRAADLSHGRRQALELCMAVSLQPRLLLLDEPTAGLSQAEREAVRQLLRMVVSSGCGVLLIEHDLEFVVAASDRIAVLHQGRIVSEGTPAHVRGSTVVREIYTGVAVA